MKGRRFGRLLVREYHGGKASYWQAICDCGTEKLIASISLRNGDSKSCGCLNRELIKKRNFKHGRTHSWEYKSWESMKSRCMNINSPDYKNYGGRGIKVCDRWLTFENFLKDMGKRSKEETIERHDNNKDYTPSNCRWATRKEQNNNKRNNVILKHKDISLNVAQWAKKLGISKNAIYKRLRRGWAIKRALEEGAI
ncbi:MAG TPA: hypothetical protein ENH85_11145 [Candidatus Scalindua sp.]|nr:hypothetical protein [Candidatus Scalindua sp.]